MLGPLRFTKLLNEIRFNVLELSYLFLHFPDLLLSLFLVEVVVFGDFMVHLGLIQLLKGDELLLMLHTGSLRPLRRLTLLIIAAFSRFFSKEYSFSMTLLW